MTEILTNLVTHYPILSTALMAMGVLRAVMKPLFSILHAAAQAASSPKLEQEVTAVETSKVVYWLTWALDYAASVKVGPQVGTIVPPPKPVEQKPAA